MRKRLAALACALTVMLGGVVAVAPASHAASFRCYYKYYPAYRYTNDAGARYLESTGSWSCYRQG